MYFTWALKGDLFRLSGNIFWPAVYLTVIIILLVMRIPAIRDRLSKTKLQG